MKSFLYVILFLLTAGNSFAQAPVADTSDNLIKKGDSYYVIDKCKISGSASLTGTIVKNPEIIPGGTPANCGDIKIRNGRGECFYYIDGVKVNGQLTDSIADSLGIEDVQVITGGLPINFGDLNSSDIPVNKTPDKVIPGKMIFLNREQNIPTE